MNANQIWKDEHYSAPTPALLATALADAGRDVLRGLFAPDYGLPARVISSYLIGNEVSDVDASTIVRGRLSKYIDERELPVLKDLAGRVLKIEDFPKEGNKLSDDSAIPIIERLRQRLLENPSGGSIAECFEHHIHYGLGTSEKLTHEQLSYLASVCALANRRPHSTIWLSRFVLDHMNDPQRIRNLLTVIDQYRKSYPLSVRGAFAENYQRIYDAQRSRWLPARPLHVLVVGFSHSVIEAVWGLAERSSDRILVSIADVEQAGRWPRPTEALRGVLAQISKVQIVNDNVPLLARAIARKRIDYVIAGAKALYLCGAGKNVSCVVSTPCADAIEAAGRTPIIIASGLYKVWAASLYKIYQRHIDAPALIGQDNRVLKLGRINMLGCERGVWNMEEFVAQDFQRALFSAADIEIFYALLTAKEESEHYEKLLSFALSEEGNANELRRATNPGEPPERSNAERLALLKRYTDNSSKRLSEFADAKASLKKLIDEDCWYDANRGKYIAIVGVEPKEQYASTSFWDALQSGYRLWPNRIFYVGKVTRPMLADKILLRQLIK